MSPFRLPFTLATPSVPRLVLRTSNTALLVQDMQRYWVDPDTGYGAVARSRGIMREFDDYYAQVAAAIARMVDVIGALRQLDMPVIYTRWAREQGEPASLLQQTLSVILTDAEPGAELHPALAPEPSEPVLCKTGFSAFAGSRLDEELRKRGIENLVITGVMSEYGIRSTALQALDMAYRPLLLSDACAGMTGETHSAMMSAMTYATMKVRSTSEFLRDIRGLDDEDIVLI